MRAVLAEPFVAQLAAAPHEVQRAFWKQLRFLLRDIQHPSLNAKKFPESGDPDLWQARITHAWRFYSVPTKAAASRRTPKQNRNGAA